MVEYLHRKYYQPRKLQMRACHPRDLVEQVVDMCRYQKREPAITRELLDAACASYFLEETESQGSRGMKRLRDGDSSSAGTRQLASERGRTPARVHAASPHNAARPRARRSTWATGGARRRSSRSSPSMAVRLGADFLQTGRFTGLLLLASEALVVVADGLPARRRRRRSQPAARASLTTCRCSARRSSRPTAGAALAAGAADRRRSPASGCSSSSPASCRSAAASA